MRHGVGTFEYANKFFRYEGEYVNGKKHGAPPPLAPRQFRRIAAFCFF